MRERDGHGIRRSLVRHRTALLGEAELGNRMLLEEIAGDPAFVPVGVLSVDRAEVVDTRGAAGRARRPAFWLEGKAAPGQEPVGRTDRPGRGADRPAADRADLGLGRRRRRSVPPRRAWACRSS